MQLHQFPNSGHQTKKRVGRGTAAGQGKTAGRGYKGQKARAGYDLPRRFEGGQTSLIQRLPKRRGFRSVLPRALTLRIDRVLARLPTGRITSQNLIAAGLIRKVEINPAGIRLVGKFASEIARPIQWSKEIHVSKALTKRLRAIQKDRPVSVGTVATPAA